uniref:Uncharacterized protein n=1 Tax=Vitrella brassicaformis TaxID=1169539 RepID=A0A7S1K8D5_9ALVE|mmetsp:Transcript_17110/g.48632  ORF Transcript_17110/g.48632 Transcript_17110/m.48632 type:complete len:123 (+) Transcript_17110:872-1240(+)
MALMEERDRPRGGGEAGRRRMGAVPWYIVCRRVCRRWGVCFSGAGQHGRRAFYVHSAVNQTKYRQTDRHLYVCIKQSASVHTKVGGDIFGQVRTARQAGGQAGHVSKEVSSWPAALRAAQLT